LKLGPLNLAALPTLTELPGLSSLPALKLPRLPLAAFRRRLLVRGVFVLLVLALLALALSLLAEEKQRSRLRYEEGFRQRLAALAAQLRHPTGQLALLNARPVEAGPQPPGGPGATQVPPLSSPALSPLLLPFSALDFDDPFKAQQAVEMSGCALRWANGAQLCAAVGQSQYAGGFVYLVAQLTLPPAVARERGALQLAAVNRARIRVALRGSEQLWTAPFEAAADAPVLNASGGLRGRLSGFVMSAEDQAAEILPVLARPDRDFRAWLWQGSECADPTAVLPACARRTLLSARVPVMAWREALFSKSAPVWPPPDLDQVNLRLQWLAPGGELLFDSAAPGATAPLALSDLQRQLLPGEQLRIDRGPVSAAGPWLSLRGGEVEEPASPWLTRLILRLPAVREATTSGNEQLLAGEILVLPSGPYRLQLTGDLRSVDRGLGVTATRLSGFFGAMLALIALAWLFIELSLLRRMVSLTRRAAALSYNMQDPLVDRRLGELEVADLRGKDELGILAGTLSDLLQRVKDGARREHLRAEQERDQWHAVGHEIMSPLQSLMVLHADPDDASHRYVQRMQQAVRVLYGTASPSEAIASAALQLGLLDLGSFVQQVAQNAAYAGIEQVQHEPSEAGAGSVLVRADEYPLEDVVTHVLRNADRHREPGTVIRLSLHCDGAMAELGVHNTGPAIAPELMQRIFEYGVSTQEDSVAGTPGTSGARRGQGLFVARTYMAKMGGTISAHNVEGGVSFLLRLPLRPV